MARKQPVRTYVRHRDRPEWGTGLLVKAGRIDNTYVFADGARRVFKAAEWPWFLDETEPPSADVQAQLERGLATGGTSTPKAMNLDFVGQIRTNRRDAGAYLAYADWLQGEKDPRGELIVIQHQLAARPRDAQLRAAERALLERHADYFLPKVLREALAQNTGVTVVWRYGFLTHVRLARRPRDGVDPVAVIPALFAHPSAELLESLALGPVGVREDPHYIRCIEAIARCKHPLLEELLVDGAHGPQARIGNISPLFAALPSLQRLGLRAFAARVGSQTKHPHLRSLSIRVETTLALAPLLRSKLPALEALELDMPDFRISPADVHAMLDGKRMPKLRRLVLRRTRNTAAVVEAILGSVQLPALEELVLADGDLSARTTELAMLKRDRLSHLRVLEVGGVVKDDPAKRRTPATVARSERARAGLREWSAIARDDEIVWGERDGHAVFLRIGTTHDGCSCSAPKPCVHLASLKALASLWPTLDERAVPDDFMPRLRR